MGKDCTFKGCDGSAGQRATQRTLSVSLLGGCSSKGCPTKSEENEDRYVHVSRPTQIQAVIIDGRHQLCHIFGEFLAQPQLLIFSLIYCRLPHFSPGGAGDAGDADFMKSPVLSYLL